MSARFWSLIRVIPSPSTLAESSAVYHHLKTLGQVKHFIKAKKSTDESNQNIKDETTYLVGFEQLPSNCLTTFEVPVHHTYRPPKEADPYNIRGLQDRKPFLKSKVLKCTLEPTQPSDLEIGPILRSNPYHEKVHLQPSERDDNYEVMMAVGAPRSIAHNLDWGTEVQEAAQIGEKETSKGSGQGPPNYKPIPMDSLIRPWRDAIAEKAASSRQQIKQDKEIQ